MTIVSRILPWSSVNSGFNADMLVVKNPSRPPRPKALILKLSRTATFGRQILGSS